MWLESGAVPPLTPAYPVRKDWYTLLGAFASAFGTSTCIWDHELLEAGEVRVEEEWNWRWLT